MISSDRIHRLGGFMFRVCLAGALGMVWLVELIATLNTGVWMTLTVVPSLAGIALILAGEGRSPRFAIGVAGLSLALTATAVALRPEGMVPGLSEVGGLLVLLVWTARRWRVPLARVGAVMLLIALLAMPARSTTLFTAFFSEVLLLPFVAGALGMAVYLYNVDERRRRALNEVRRGERLELARELHDFVAHHVTGIVVRAQAAQYLPGDEPERHREAFASIEHAGVEALSSMRRLVAMMREEGDPASLRPLGDFAQLSDLVTEFSTGGRIATLRVGEEVDPERLAPEVSATIHRVVRESLTNIRKHSPTAGLVTVSIATTEHGVELAVDDDGGGRRGLLSQVGGGYGLAGLSERVAAVGGRFDAGPRAEGGWRVRAVLPHSEQEGDRDADDGTDR